jgi:RNA polymerase sigma-70 factor (ECF subfamily)
LRERWDLERDPLAALRRGDARVFEAFVLAETRTFFSFFRRLGAGRFEAEDLVQDLFLKLFCEAPHYEARERFAAFAFRIAHNAWVDRARRQRGTPQAFLDGEHESATPPPQPLESLARDEAARRLDDAIRVLPERHRLVFELGAIQELSYAEIAGLLGIPVGTVKSRMFHALRKLRDALGSTLEGALPGRRG